MVITIGQRTQVLIQQHIMQAHTIIFNGPSGDLVYPRTIQAMKTLFESFCKSNAYKVVAGGDSLALLEHFKLTSCVSYCSTGGGASIAYLSGQQLAGLQVFVTS
jgi:phosphoglycerate kinase